MHQKQNNRTSRQRCIALFIGFILILSLMISICYLAKYEIHDCIGDKCGICHELMICRSVLKAKNIIIGFVLITITFRPFAEQSVWAKRQRDQAKTLITLKVKLLN